MPELTQCQGRRCDRRDTCQRFTNRSKRFQLRGSFDINPSECEHYLSDTSAKDEPEEDELTKIEKLLNDPRITYTEVGYGGVDSDYGWVVIPFLVVFIYCLTC